MPKKKRKFKKVVVFIFILFILGFFGVLIYFGFGNKLRNIYISNNNLLSDQQIIELAKLEDYPNFYTTFIGRVKKNILKCPYIKDVKVKKGFLSIYIDVLEYKPLFIREDNKTIVLENKKELPYDNEILNIPILVNYVPDLKYDLLIKKYNRLSDDIINKISEIKYDPNDKDEDRFLLFMNDQNQVYLTLTKFELINKYNDAVVKLNGAKGILYLDAGNFFKKME